MFCRQMLPPSMTRASQLALVGLVLGTSACGQEVWSRPTTDPIQHEAALSHRPRGLARDPRLGRLSEDTVLRLRVVMALQHEEELDQFLADIHDPQSARFGETLTPEAFRQRYLPDDGHRQFIRSTLAEHGFLMSDDDGPGHIITAHVRARDAENFFNTELATFVDPASGETRHAPRGPVMWPASLKIAAVHGLSSPAKHRSRHYKAEGLWSLFGYRQPLSAEQIRSVYQLPADAQGQGQDIGVVELDGFDQQDLAAYAQANKLRQVPIKQVLLNGYDGRVVDKEAQVEVTMDIQLINALAPKAREIRVFAAENTGSAAIDIYHEIANPTTADHKLIKTISTSWGISEDQMSDADLHAEAAIFKQMAAQGQTLFAAAGDSGARDDGRQLSVDDPAAQPWVVGVGGTTLDSDRGVWHSEKTWKHGGGGISQVWAAPSWQRSLDTHASRGSTVQRNVPDVALNADPKTGYDVIVNGQSVTVGGTSCAAPLWAAFFGLANEARAKDGHDPLPFGAPILYSLGVQGGTTLFHDIGDHSTNGYFQAVPGFDDATGWGSFVGDRLLDALRKH